MDLQAFISNHSDYLSQFRNRNLHVYKKHPYALVKYKYSNPPSPEDPEFSWKRYCRGAVINTETNRVVCVPPPKAVEITSLSELPETTDEVEYSILVDGTMINVFWSGTEWMICTRGEIGGYNRWLPGNTGKRKSFKQMFEECSMTKDCLDELPKQYSYSFLMRHKDNRNVSPIRMNHAILVEAYQYDSTIQRIKTEEYKTRQINFKMIVAGSSQPIQCFGENVVIPTYACKGYTVKYKHARYKYINPAFAYVKRLKDIGDSNNPYLNYLQIRQSGQLKEYLRYYPENQVDFTHYRDKIHSLTNDLYTNYKNVHVTKSKDKKDIPFHLKPFVYDIHGKYLETKQPTTWTHVKDYIYHLPPKRLMFALNRIDESVGSENV